MYRALTGKSKDGQDVAPADEERKKYWATTFRALGDIVHLIQDMAQPQHTRNDAHFGQCFPFLTGHTSIYEKYIESRAVGVPYELPSGRVVNAGLLNYGDYEPPRFTDYTSFFTTRHKENDLLKRKGMADYSNRGFFSAGTNLSSSEDARYQHPSNNPPSYPRRLLGVDWRGEPLGGDPNARVELFLGVVADALNPALSRTCTSANDPGCVALTTFGAWDQFLEERRFLSRYTLNRYNYDAMADLLIPRAVAYSAGLLDYFFRARLEIQDAGFTNDGIVLRVKNAIDPTRQAYWKDEALAAGGKMVVTVRYERPAPAGGTSTHHHTSAVTLLNEDIKPGRAAWNVYRFTNIPLPPLDAMKVQYRVVYRGRIGQEEDALAVGTFKPVSGFLVTPNYAPADGLSSAGQSRLIYYANNAWHLSKDTAVQAGNIDWKGWYIGGRPTKVLSWVGPPVRYFPETESFEFGTHRFRSFSSFGTAIYEGGEIFAVAPANVLGAAVARDNKGFDWLIVVCAEGSIDVVYRRPYKRSLSAALYDPVNEPDGWEQIGASNPALGDPPGSFTQAADIPWFFNGSGTEAQTMRRWWSAGTDSVVGQLKRLKLEIVNDVSRAQFSIVDRGDQGFIEERTCSASYDQFGAGSGQRTSTSRGEYTFAVDYKDDRAVFAKIRVEGSSNSRSTVTVIHNHAPDQSHGSDILVGKTDHDASDYREYLVWDTGEKETFSDIFQPYTVSWTSGATTPTYNRTINREIREHEITYLLDLRSDYYGYYFLQFTDKDVIANSAEQNAQEGNEGSEFLKGTSSETLHANTFPSFTSERSLYARTFEIRCAAGENRTFRRYGTSNFGWWSYFGKALGSAVINSAEDLAHSQRLLADFGYQEVGTFNRLANGSFESVVPNAPPGQVTYYPIRVVR